MDDAIETPILPRQAEVGMEISWADRAGNHHVLVADANGVMLPTDDEEVAECDRNGFPIVTGKAAAAAAAAATKNAASTAPADADATAPALPPDPANTSTPVDPAKEV